jgi:hypothetical protein
MTRPLVASLVVISAMTFVVGRTLVAQDRFAVKSPNGIAFAEFKGYDDWAAIAPSQTDDGAMGCMEGKCVKAILGNATMMKAYRDGIPANGKAVPDGAVMAKVEWAKSANPASPYVVTVPGKLNDVSFMVKDSKRFPDTNGWGYAQFRYDPASRTFTPYGKSPTFAKADCHQCHINGAKATDFVDTKYAPR